MATKKDLEQLEVPAVLLEDGRIITGETLKEAYLEEYNAITEAIKSKTVERHLIPKCVEGEDLGTYLEFANEVVSNDNFWIEDDELLHKIVYFYVEDNNGHAMDVIYFDESFTGIWEDFKTYAYDIADCLELRSQTPEELENYINWEGWISDLKLDYTEFVLPNGLVAIFKDHH